MEVADPISDPGGSFHGIPEVAAPDTMDQLSPFNNDSSLVQMLDDLQEGTLLSLLEDDHLFSDLRDCPLSPSGEPLSCLNGGADGLNLDGFNVGIALEELFGGHGELVEFGAKELDSTGFNSSEVEILSSGSGSSSSVMPPHDGNKAEELVSGKLRDGETQLQSQLAVPLSKVNSSSSVLAASPLPPPTLRKRAPRSCEKASGCKKPRVMMSLGKGTAAVRSYSGSDSDISSTDSDSTEFDAPPKGVSGLQAGCSGRPVVVANASSPKSLLACVQHDHCYALRLQEHPPGGQSSPLSVGDTSIEEGNNSDAGYETMSASTSPGSSSGAGHTGHAPKASPPPIATAFPSAPLPPLPPLGSNVDPVALIDARIKHFMCSQQINLTEEEKETLKVEGMPIPTTLPLTKTEERALKSVRRKIRNKVAAQESRKRKKEHLHTLEDRVMLCTSENLRLKKKVETLESENKSLVVQLRKLKAVVTASTAMGGSSRTTQVGACLMVVVLCFAIFFGSWTPLKLWGTPATDYTTATVRSRSLLSLDSRQNFQQAACSWFRHTFFRDDPPADSPLPHTRWREEDAHGRQWPSDLDLYAAVTPITIQRNNLTQNSHISAKA